MQHTDFRRELGRAVLGEFFAHKSDADARTVMYGICRECGRSISIVCGVVSHSCEQL